MRFMRLARHVHDGAASDGRDERLWFVEFNGRDLGSMALSPRTSLEYPAWTVKLALNRNRSRQIISIAQKKSFVATWEASSCMCRCLRGPQSRAIRKWPSFWGTLIEVFRTNWKSSSITGAGKTGASSSAIVGTRIREQVFKSR